MFLVCKNSDGDLFNIWGLTNCTDDFECREGFEGKDCNTCSPLYYPINGKTIVNPTNGEGVDCQSMYHFQVCNCSFDVIIPFLESSCDQDGAMNCNTKGECLCKDGFEPPLCDKCIQNVYGPKCKLCEPIGSLNCEGTKHT